MTTFLILFMVGVIFQEMFAAEKGIAMAETVTMIVGDLTLIALLTVQNPKDFSPMRKTVENIGNAMPISLNIMHVTKVSLSTGSSRGARGELAGSSWGA